jgi:hypothetical protein
MIGLFGFLFAVLAIAEVWPVIVVAVGFGLLAWWWWRWDNRVEARAAAARAELAETAARAERRVRRVSGQSFPGECGDRWRPDSSAVCTKVAGHGGLHEWDQHDDGVPLRHWWRCRDGTTVPRGYSNAP